MGKDVEKDMLKKKKTDAEKKEILETMVKKR